MKSDTPKGQCVRCGEHNAYTATICSACGSRLPWADAVSSRARANASTHAPPSIANARATVNTTMPTGQDSTASAYSRRWFGLAGVVALLVVGILSGAALIVPAFISSSKPAPQSEIQPTPASTVTEVAPSTPAPPVSSPTQPQPIESQAPDDASNERMATREEEEYFAGFNRAVDNAGKALRVVNDNPGDATSRASARADLNQAMIELNSLVMPEHLVRAGMPAVVSLLRESVTEWRFCLSTLEDTFDDSGKARDQAALEVAIKHGEKANSLHKSAQQKMREVRDKLSR